MNILSSSRGAGPRGRALGLAALVLGGCSLFEASPSVRSVPNASEAQAARALQTPARAFALLHCGLESLSNEQECQRLATQEGVAQDALFDPSPDIVDQLTERLRTQAQGERMPLYERSALLRWFDLSAQMLREARHAADGLQCARLDACTARAHGHPPLDEAELALHVDTAAARSYVALEALLRFAQEQGPYATDAEALALVVLRWRGAAAQTARPEVLSEALSGWLTTMQRALPEPAAPAERDAHGARQQPDGTAHAPSLDAARQRLEARLRQVLDRVEVPALRSLAQQALAPGQSTG